MEYGSLEPFLKYGQRRSSNANGLCWRTLAHPAGVITTSQIHSSYLARARISVFESYHPNHPVGLCGRRDMGKPTGNRAPHTPSYNQKTIRCAGMFQSQKRPHCSMNLSPRGRLKFPTDDTLFRASGELAGQIYPLGGRQCRGANLLLRKAARKKWLVSGIKTTSSAEGCEKLSSGEANPAPPA
jgi:hypothetical protein